MGLLTKLSCYRNLVYSKWNQIWEEWNIFCLGTISVGTNGVWDWKKFETNIPIVTKQHFWIYWSSSALNKSIHKLNESGSCLVLMLFPCQILSPLKGIIISHNLSYIQLEITAGAWCRGSIKTREEKTNCHAEAFE